MIKLCDVGVGETVKIISLDAVGYAKEHLLALGLIPNKSVKVIRKGQRNLTIYHIEGKKIALRSEESQFINVVPI